jgi:hypothetical protein
MRRTCTFFVLYGGLLAAGIAAAGGPLLIRTNGLPFVWSTASEIQYRTDSGDLSPIVSEGAAQASVRDMFDVWQDVGSASISYNRAGPILDAGVFTDGDVSTAVEYDAVLGACNAGSQSPIIYDATGEIVADVVGDDLVIGFAGPCNLDVTQGLITSSRVVMNGLFRDGIDNANNFELTEAEFNATFIHEFGHFSGLDHSQINVECVNPAACGSGSDNLEGLPTMFPFLVSDAQGSLSKDDIAWISKLYPAAGGAGFNASHGIVSGTVYFTDGESHAQLVNVVARLVDNVATPEDESRRTAASAVSGATVRVFRGNPISAPSDQPLGPFGSEDPDALGRFEIPLPPGSYTLEVESIDPAFVDGSSVGGSERIDMPGTAPPPIGPLPVAAGVTSAGNDLVLRNTPPRLDPLEGP